MQKPITTRLDNLPFSRWHLILILGIGTVWFFDGYQVSLLVQLSKYILENHSETQYKSLATIYQVGCIVGSISFGIFSYYHGRRFVFMITLFLYSVGIILCIVTENFGLFLLGRLLTGISVGGEFTAVFTAIDQFLPPKVRGRADIIIDGSWHLGGTLAAVLNMIIGEVQFWRGFFIVGAIGVCGIYCIRRGLPQSPRWLISKGRQAQAQIIIQQIERKVIKYSQQSSKISDKQQNLDIDAQNAKQQVNCIQEQENDDNIDRDHLLDNHKSQTQLLCEQLALLTRQYKSRIFLSCFLIFSQAMFINYIFFSFPIILKNRYNFDQRQISTYLLPISLCAFLSTVIVGPFFDIAGRKIMLLITYCVSGIILALVNSFQMSAIPYEICIVFMFIFASPASSSANLIASQIFPTRCRTIVLSFIFILSMAGGICGVWINIWPIIAALMFIGGILGWWMCPEAENKSLEEINEIK